MVTVVCHPYHRIRAYSLIYLFILWLIGVINLNYYTSSVLWFWWSGFGEALIFLASVHFFCCTRSKDAYGADVKPQPLKLYWRSYLLLITPTILFLLNIWQSFGWHIESVLYDWYLADYLYIRLNALGLEVTLATLWSQDKVIGNIRQKITVPNIAVFWALLTVSYLSGNY